MQINTDLLHKINSVASKNLDGCLQKTLAASVEHGYFGMQMLDQLHEQLPRTRCDDCGKCCNSVSIFSLEYHRLIREIMATWSPERLRRLVKSALCFDLRQAEIGEEKRLRCIFRDDKTRACLIHPVRPFACRIFGLLKENGTRECDKVHDLHRPETVITQDYLISLQAKVLDNSESYRPFPGEEEIHFFPFEFWFFRNVFSPERALQIYREILVPMSSPLTRLWQKRLKPSEQTNLQEIKYD